MKLYMHPVATTARPVRLFCAESGISLDEEVVDLMTGAHHKEPYASLNPSRQVPLLVDGDMRLTESSAILKYLADKHDSPAYPKDLQKRAKVNEMMDWLNTGLMRDLGYNMVYPQLYPHHKRRSDEAQAGTIAWGQAGARKWLLLLDEHWLGAGQPYLCGDQITIADYFGASAVTLAELIDCDLSQFPNVSRWLSKMKSLKNWDSVNQVFSAMVAGNKGKSFEVVTAA
jgi:glutathione S-transferase